MHSVSGRHILRNHEAAQRHLQLHRIIKCNAKVQKTSYPGEKVHWWPTSDWYPSFGTDSCFPYVSLKTISFFFLGCSIFFISGFRLDASFWKDERLSTVLDTQDSHGGRTDVWIAELELLERCSGKFQSNWNSDLTVQGVQALIEVYPNFKLFSISLSGLAKWTEGAWSRNPSSLKRWAVWGLICFPQCSWRQIQKLLSRDRFGEKASSSSDHSCFSRRFRYGLHFFWMLIMSILSCAS